MPLVGTKGAYTIFIYPDEYPDNPRDWDNTGTMVCFHSRYNLGDKHEYTGKDDFLRDLYLETVGNDDAGENKYSRLMDTFATPEYGGYGSSQYARAFDGALLETISRKHVVLPLYLYDHSSLTMNTSGFSCPWDSGQVGWIYANKETIIKEFGGKNLTAEKRALVETLLRSEVETYNYYLRGDCLHYELYKKDTLVDSCSGFLGTGEQVLEAIAFHLPDKCKGILDNLAEFHPRQSIKDKLRQARATVENIPKPARSASMDAR